MIKRFILNRLREQSTWRGLVGLATFFGAALSPEQMDKIAAAGLAIYLAIETFFPSQLEKPQSAAETIPVPEPSVVQPETAVGWDGKVPGQFP